MACFVCLTRKYYEKNFQFHFYSSYGMLGTVNSFAQISSDILAEV